MPLRVQAEAEEIEYFDNDLLRVRFALPEKLEFQAGQFMSIAVEGYIRRSYSIANPPHVQGFVETFVDASPGGPGSKYFLQLKEGDKSDLLLPLGQFVYKESHLPVMFFATGTGIVPFLSMIKHELERVNSDRSITLFYGVRNHKRVMVGDMLDEWARVNSNFNYHLFISRPESPLRPGQLAGRFTQAIPAIDFESTEVYICGGGGMINEVEQMVFSQNGERDKVFYERYY